MPLDDANGVIVVSVETLSIIERDKHETPLFLEEVLSSLKQGAVVLDAGCGGGSFQQSKFQNLSIVSVDIREPQGPGSSCVPQNFIVGDVEKLPIPTSSIDFLILNYVLEHVSDADATIREAARVLKHEGLLYAALPNSRSFDDRFYRFAGYFAKYCLFKLRKKPEHQQCFDFVSLNRLFYRGGFRLLSFCECPSGYTWMNDPRIKRFQGPFLRMLRLVREVCKVDLFKASNYLALYRYVGMKGIRDVTHVCSSCGMQLKKIADRPSGLWKCPYCGGINVHG